MKALTCGFVVAFLLGAKVGAQVGEQPGALAPQYRHVADAIGTAAVYGQIGADTVHSLRLGRAGDWHAAKCQAVRLGIGAGVPFLLKAVIHETRPDGSDDHSFPSQHTAIAVASAGWQWSAGVSLSAFVGSSRVAANKHHWGDVLAGAGIGALAQWVCR